MKDTEDAILKTMMQFFAQELLPCFGIHEKAVGFAPTELVNIEITKLYQDFNLVMENHGWYHFEFQSTNGGLTDLKRFHSYEALSSYQHKVPVTTYVLYSRTIRHPMTEFTEGINTYRVIPIIMKDQNADTLIADLQDRKARGLPISKQELVQLSLCPLMAGSTSMKDRISAAYAITDNAASVSCEELEKIEAVIYTMANKFLEPIDMEEFRKEMRMTKLGQMLINDGIEQTKLENAKNLIDILDERIIAERIGLPLETVQKLKQEAPQIK